MWTVGTTVNMSLVSPTPLVIKNVIFLNNEEEDETQHRHGQQLNNGYIIFITAIFTIIGLFIGLIIVGIGTMRVKLFPVRLDFGKRSRELQPIVSSPVHVDHGGYHIDHGYHASLSTEHVPGTKSIIL